MNIKLRLLARMLVLAAFLAVVGAAAVDSASADGGQAQPAGLWLEPRELIGVGAQPAPGDVVADRADAYRCGNRRLGQGVIGSPDAARRTADRRGGQIIGE